jgi:transposase-like protein
MLQIHPNARTAPITRAEIARSHERTGGLAQRYGVSAETIRKWRKRGASDCLDHPARPHQLSWKAINISRFRATALTAAPAGQRPPQPQ